MGEGARAIDELHAALRTAPGMALRPRATGPVDGDEGQAADATSSLEEALGRFPTAQPLWETLLNVQLRRGAYETLAEIVERAGAAGVSSPEFAIYRGIHAAEFDTEPYPAALFGPASDQENKALSRWRVRHLLRVGEIDAALELIDREMAREETAELWAYAATAWRLAGDPRSKWLEGDGRLVNVIDLSDALPPVETVAETLRTLHVARGEYLDQSVRGGTQTDGPLLSRIDPVIRRLAKRHRRRGRDLSRTIAANRSRTPAPPSRSRPEDSLCRKLVGPAAVGWSSFEPRPSAGMDQLGALPGASGSFCRRDRRRRLVHARRTGRQARPRPCTVAEGRTEAGSAGAFSIMDVARHRTVQGG